MGVLKVVTPPVKVTLGPLAGAVNVTSPSSTGSENALLTVAKRDEGKPVLMIVLWGVPLVAVIEKPRDSNAPI